MEIRVSSYDLVPRNKMIDGRRYTLAMLCETQGESKAEKGHFRAMGNLARQAKVVCGGDVRWAVYVC